MYLTFYYDFGEFRAIEFEADYDDAKEYIMRTRSLDDIIEDYINTLYDKESEENKETLKTYDGFDGTKESMLNMEEDTKKELVDEVLFDLINKTPIYYNELYDYFEQEAYDEYVDSL